jgi:hypothetical protein
MEEQPEEISGEEIVPMDGVAPLVGGDNVQFGPGLALLVSAERDLTMTHSAAGVVTAGQGIEMTQSSARVAVAGSDINIITGSANIVVVGNQMSLDTGNAGVVKAGGDIDLTYSQALVLAGNQVTVQKSKIGLVLSRQTNLGEGSRVLLNTPQVLALGVSFGAAYAVVRWLLKR